MARYFEARLMAQSLVLRAACPFAFGAEGTESFDRDPR